MERRLMAHKLELMEHTRSIQTDKDCFKYLGKKWIAATAKGCWRFFFKTCWKPRNSSNSLLPGGCR